MQATEIDSRGFIQKRNQWKRYWEAFSIAGKAREADMATTVGEAQASLVRTLLPPPGYQTFQLAHQTLLKLHTCCYGLLLVLLPGLPQRQNIVAFHGHHHHIRPLHCPHVFESLASHSKSNVYASDYPSLGSMHKP